MGPTISKMPFEGFGAFNGQRNLGPGILGGPRFGGADISGRGRGNRGRATGKPETCTRDSINDVRHEPRNEQ